MRSVILKIGGILYRLDLPRPQTRMQKSHHQDDITFFLDRESQAKPLFAMIASWVGGRTGGINIPTTYSIHCLSQPANRDFASTITP